MPFIRVIKQSQPWFLLGLSKKDWVFLTWYTPLTFIIIHGGSILIERLLNSPIATNQAANIEMIATMPIALTFILTVIIAPICEEWLFRGPMLMNTSGKRPGWLAVIISGVIFGLLHVPNTIASTWSYLLMGLSYAARYTKSVEAPIAIHMMNNFIGFLLIIR